MMRICTVILVSYLIGCFTTGYYLVRLVCGSDIRTVSSGNVGSRNVGRLLGAKGFILTFLGDAGKGLLVVWLARQAGSEAWLVTAALVAVTAGHVWPLQLRFRGGKGFATYAGGMVLLQPLLLAVSVVLCAVLYPVVRGTTKTALLVLGCTPLLMVVAMYHGKILSDTLELLLYCLLVGMVLYAHRSNISKEFFAKAATGS